MRKTKKILIKLYLEKSPVDFLKALAKRNHITVEELLTNMVFYFHTGFLAGEFHKDMRKRRLI